METPTDNAPTEDSQLHSYAAEGRLTKHALATTLAPEARERFLETCAAIEKKYTEECGDSGDPCMEAGCSARGEICLQPLLRAGTEFHKKCGVEWAKLYIDKKNRAGSR
jgi:hypothetical protein